MPSSEIVAIELQPYDENNKLLQSQVAPLDWVNPVPKGRYNLVVIGAGTAGLVTAAGAAGLGAKVALIERNLMGGDCLNVGCVPSKALISSARQTRNLPVASKPDFGEVMQRMRRLRASISPADSAARFKSLGVDVYFGQAEFVGGNKIKVAGSKLLFSKAVIATGARASKLPIPGLDQVNYLTNESLFSLTELPDSMIIVGGGPIGCEMAQAFANFGCKVTLLEKHDRILVREDSEATAIVQKALLKDGVQIICGAKIAHIDQTNDKKTVSYTKADIASSVSAQALLIGIGRTPNVAGLGLENVDVKCDLKLGVEVNDRLQTSNKRIYAAGDVTSKFKFTHAADFMARTVIKNALFLGRSKVSELIIPWCTYTTPELAQIGLTDQQAAEQKIAVDSYTVHFADLDRAIVASQTEGFVKIHCQKGKDKIVGATVVAENAGDLIGELSLAMTNRIGLGKIANAIHPYPTIAEAIRKAGDQYNKTRLTPFVKRLFGVWLRSVAQSS